MSQRHPRRGATVAIAALGLGAAMTACSSDTGEVETVTYAGYGGSYNDSVAAAYFEHLPEAIGVEVELTDGASDIAKIIESVKAGNPITDILDVSDHDYGQLLNADVLEPLDTDIVKAPSLIDWEGIPQDLLVTDYGISSYAFSRNIMWNTDAVPGIASWKDVWDTTSYPGQRGFQNYPQMLLETALLADGVPTDQIYPIDVDRAFESLDRIKGQSIFVGTSQLENLVAQGEVVAGNLSLGRVMTLKEDGVPVDYSWDQAVTEMNRLVVLKGSKNKEAAMRVIAETLEPEPQLELMELTGYSPTNTEAWDQIDEETAALLSGSPVNAPRALFLDFAWWADNIEEIAPRFQDWLAE